jgi:transcription initiation factor TFIIB
MLSLNDELFDLLKKNNLNDVEEDMEEKENIDDSFCGKCTKYSLTNRNGQLVCISCGNIEGFNIDNGAEWRYYGSEDSKGSDPNRCGMPTNSLLPEFSLGSVIPFKCNESWDMRKIRNYNTWIGSCYREKSLYNVFETMTIRAKSKGIPGCIIEDAKYKYKIISEAKISRGENRKGIIASCIYEACKENNSSRSTKEIAEIFRISSTSMTKGFKKYNEIMQTIDIEKKRIKEENISEPLDFINRFCSNLNLEHEILDICKYVCIQIEKYDLVSENTPTSKAAGSIYLVSYLFNLDLNKRDISTICMTSEVTISKCFTKLIEYYIYLLPNEMLKYLALDFINKFGEIVGRYYNPKIYKHFFTESLSLFQKLVKLEEKVIENDRYIIYLSAGIVYYFIQKLDLSNIGIKEITNIFHINNKHIQEYYEIINNLKGLYNI